jgi:hypothetical protein
VLYRQCSNLQRPNGPNAADTGNRASAMSTSAAVAEWVCPAGPNLLAPDVVYNPLKNDMGCSDDEVEASGFEEPRCWFRFTDNRYVGLENRMANLADFCRREHPDGIAGYADGGGVALLVAAARDAGHDEIRPYASHAPPDKAECCRPIVNCLARQT